MSERLRYAKAGETPGWMGHNVVDLDSGKVLDNVFEVNEDEGWAVIYEKDENGRLVSGVSRGLPPGPVKKRITGRFMLERVADRP